MTSMLHCVSLKNIKDSEKIRTETINKIKIKYNTNSDLIEPIHSEEYRRFYKYIINENNGKMILT